MAKGIEWINWGVPDEWLIWPAGDTTAALELARERFGSHEAVLDSVLASIVAMDARFAPSRPTAVGIWAPGDANATAIGYVALFAWMVANNGRVTLEQRERELARIARGETNDPNIIASSVTRCEIAGQPGLRAMESCLDGSGTVYLRVRAYCFPEWSTDHVWLDAGCVNLLLKDTFEEQVVQIIAGMEVK
ncbi:MAG: hypothetical protein LBH11_05950 [Propionibacteriaceae bacterium]|nr:hypothetical protein [Propionibacteriaceae bacterium]